MIFLRLRRLVIHSKWSTVIMLCPFTIAWNFRRIIARTCRISKRLSNFDSNQIISVWLSNSLINEYTYINSIHQLIKLHHPRQPSLYKKRIGTFPNIFPATLVLRGKYLDGDFTLRRRLQGASPDRVRGSRGTRRRQEENAGWDLTVNRLSGKGWNFAAATTPRLNGRFRRYSLFCKSIVWWRSVRVDRRWIKSRRKPL